MPSIYKYTSFRPEFLDNFYLKLSRFGEFNDPFEMVMGNYLSSVSQEEYDEIMSLSHTLSDGASYIDAAWDAQYGVRAVVGALCFTRKAANLLMWAHYANNHEGICIEFDAKAEFFNGKYKDATKRIFTDEPQKDHYQNIGVLRNVEYQVERPTYVEPQELEHNTDSWFVKSPEWAYEEEARLLLPLELAIHGQDKNLLFYTVSPEMIKSITLGCQMRKEQKEQIYDRCVSLGINVKEAFVHSHQFKLDIVDYAEDNHNNYINQYNLNRITRW